jgi:cystathionine beta-synthase
MDEKNGGMTAHDIVMNRKNTEVVTIDKKETIGKAIRLMSENDFSQIPVTSEDRMVGSLNDNVIFNHILKNPHTKDEKVETVMKDALPFVDITASIDELANMTSGEQSAVLVKDFKAGRTFIITKSDIVEALVK